MVSLKKTKLAAQNEDIKNRELDKPHKVALDVDLIWIFRKRKSSRNGVVGYGKYAFSIQKHCQHDLVRPHRQNLKMPFCNKIQNMFLFTSFHKQKMMYLN